MMRRSPYLAIILAMVILGTPNAVLAREAFTPAELILLDRARDGTRVTLEGEAIGEDLRADDDHRWVNLLGEAVAVGVYMHESDAAVIDAYGSYKHTGDVVRVTGILNIACDEHGGEFDVHAEIVQVVSEGAPVSRRPEWWKLVAAIGAGAIFVVQVLLYRRLRSGELRD